MNGLAWGSTAISLSGAEVERMDMSGNITDGGGGGVEAPEKGASVSLTDIVGSRKVVLKAVIDGMSVESDPFPVIFGAGPLSVFASQPLGTSYNWFDAADACKGTAGDLALDMYQPLTKLPTQAQLKAVATSGAGGQNGASQAAGWINDGIDGPGGVGSWSNYWTGEDSPNDGSSNEGTITVAMISGYIHQTASWGGPVTVCVD
jgi:hypothetical protein